MERLSRGRSQRIASNKEKSFENGSKMPPRRLQKRSKIAPRWLPGGSRAPPESANESGHLFLFIFFASWAALGALLGRSWRLLGRSWRLLGRSWALPGLWNLLGLFLKPLEKHENLDFRRQLQRKSKFLASPGGPKIEPRWLPNRSWARLGASWRSLGASRRCLGVSWRPLGALGASLGLLLGRSWGDFSSKGKSARPLSDLTPGLIPTAFPPRHSPLRG